MAIELIGNPSGVRVNTDANGNLYTAAGLKAYSVGGEYAVAGWSTAAVAAALAANTSLISLRFAPASGRKAYLTRLRFSATVITPGANGGVPGILAWQRFTAATPTGGNARTVDKKTASHPSNTDMTDVRDSNAALTVTGVTFGNVVAASIMPTFPELTSGAINGWFEWIFEPDDEPVTLAAGDGLAMRTQVAMPATTTWGFAYTVHWFEK
jgi:hypothetical protein